MARPDNALLDLAAGRPVHVSDAGALVKSAIEHRMMGLLLAEARRHAVELPPEHHRVLAAASLGTRSHHERLWGALLAVTQLLRDHGYDVATAKGVAAERRWYDRIGERPCGDVDLLLDPALVPHAAAVVELMEPGHRLLPHLDALAASGALQSVDVVYEGVHLDLHFDILKLGVPIRQNELVWERTRMVPSPAGPEVRMLDAEMSLILFLLHLLKDRFSYLLGFVDVLRVIQRETLDWGFVDQFVRAEGLEALVYETLDIVHETLDVPSPPHPAVRGWRRPAWDALWPASIRLGGYAGRIAHHRRQFAFPFLMKGRVWDGTRALARLAFPPRDLMDHYHPDTHGPYLGRLAVGRVRRQRARRRSIKRRESASG